MRRPERVRRGGGNNNEVAPADGFAAALPARRDENRQLVEDNSMGAHFMAIATSDLRDDIDDETAEARAAALRLTDNFGAVFNQYRQQIEGGNGPVYDPRELGNHHRPQQQALLAGPQRGQAAYGNPRANVPARAGGNAVVARDPNLRVHGQGGMNGFVPLRTLGGYMLGQIRRLGRDIFAQYAGNMELEDINMMGAIQGQAQFHSQDEVRNTIRFITENGNEVTSDNLDFGQNVPGYRAQASLWEVDQFNFLIVRDNHGEYVYGWPRAPRPAIAQAPNVPRLR